MLFFALALSWVKELMENIIPDSRYITLGLRRSKNDSGKVQHLVGVGGIFGPKPQQLSLSHSSYELLSAFIEARLTDDWLEIKPKNDDRSTGRTYPISDHNQIKRLIQNLLDELFGKGAWTQNHHYLPLREALFEMSDKRDRRIRLRLPVENVGMG